MVDLYGIDCSVLGPDIEDCRDNIELNIVAWPKTERNIGF